MTQRIPQSIALPSDHQSGSEWSAFLHRMVVRVATAIHSATHSTPATCQVTEQSPAIPFAIAHPWRVWRWFS
ncbi:MAG: hypothetical protein H7838_03970 [Magnetococcus sp. DMHC-8]